VNPLAVIPLLVYAALATMWPNQVDGGRRGKSLLLVEAAIVAATVIAGYFLARLAAPSSTGYVWGRVGLYVTAYLYVCGRGVAVVRAVLELPDLRMRREDDRSTGAVAVARGRAIGILERAIVLTLVLVGQYGALGLVVAAKSLARFKNLEDREFAEYFLVGTLASLLLALAAGLAVKGASGY
jgi:hypothetical protein